MTSLSRGRWRWRLIVASEVERYHMTQYDKPYESTLELDNFIRTVFATEDRLWAAPKGRVLDVGCGAGAVIHWFDESGLTSECEVIGVDNDQPWLTVAQDRNPSREFVRQSFLDPLPPCDTALSVQTLSFIEDWRPAMRELLACAKSWVFVTSLFWNGVETHTHASDGDKVSAHYNIIDARAFEKFCKRFGGAIAEWRVFTPSTDLVAPHDQLRSRSTSGATFSGPIYMPWRFAAVRKA